MTPGRRALAPSRAVRTSAMRQDRRPEAAAGRARRWCPASFTAMAPRPIVRAGPPAAASNVVVPQRTCHGRPGHDLFPPRAAASTPAGLGAAAAPGRRLPATSTSASDINARETCGGAVSRGQSLMLAGDRKGQDPDADPNGGRHLGGVICAAIGNDYYYFCPSRRGWRHLLAVQEDAVLLGLHCVRDYDRRHVTALWATAAAMEANDNGARQIYFPGP